MEAGDHVLGADFIILVFGIWSNMAVMAIMSHIDTKTTKYDFKNIIIVKLTLIIAHCAGIVVSHVL